ncbi:MAG: hypothetical protein KIH01_00780 [Candidatus Freyarchaeota archaeon]|nr:hypothetical protein [Candidatus Jordarchaeia archaeon]
MPQLDRNPIQDILVIGSSGVCLASATDTWPSQIVGGLMSAIMALGRDTLGSELEGLDFKDGKIYCVANDKGICAVAFSSEKLPGVIVKLILEDVLEKFMAEYGETLRSWDGNLKAFEGIHSYLRDIISRPFVETAIRVFFSRAGLEGVVLYDLEEGRVLFSLLPTWFMSMKKMATVAAMIASFANKLSEEVGGGRVETVIFGGKEKWIVVLVKGRLCLMNFLPRTEKYDMNSLVEASSLLLDFTLKITEKGGG